MLDLDQYASLGAALSAALDRWPNETCLIEADRDRDKARAPGPFAQQRTGQEHDEQGRQEVDGRGFR